ncbi:tetratricopeptide repeat protein [Roseibium sp.]|uniref:tetratricopeptide repeat protein n=1 Tax=Roseibium sp. TaxID=1936156 RepID=UPI003A96AB72
MRKFFLVGGFVAAMGSGALAFDGTPAPNPSISPSDVSPVEALRNGARQYYSGDKAGAINSLRYAAENGQPMAAWKLGKMYATGDGVQEDDLKAFEYYSQVVREHGDDHPDAPDAPFVASAFVALGKYYLNGISESVPQNAGRAKQIFTHAASYFGDPDAQYELGMMYQPNNGRLAVRWFNLAAIKGHVGAQARLGETLFSLGTSESRKARGLMWMSVAREQAKGNPDAAWIGTLHEQYFAHADEPVRRLASSMTETWMHRNRPDLITAATAVAGAAAQPASQPSAQ